MADDSRIQSRILDAAEKLCQTRGYNGFSFRDLAEIVGIRSASIHYHFPTKADLGKALIMRYRQKMETAFGDIERRETSAPARVRRMVAMLREIIRDENRMCLCGILAAEAGTLSVEMKTELKKFFEGCEAWLASQLATGREKGQLNFAGEPATAARAMFAALEGAMIASRAFDDERRLTDSAEWMLNQLVPA